MKENIRLTGLTALALLIGSTAVHAQVGTITGTRQLEERLEDIEEDIQEDLEEAEDPYRFGTPEFRPGFSGSASIGYSGSDGNTDEQNLTIGARLRHAQGPFVQNFGLVLDYAETDGNSDQEDIFMVYEGNYYFNEQFYGFVLGRAEFNGLADELDVTGDLADVPLAERVKTDGFIGFGPGYRVVNRPDMTWRVQAGIGVSYLEFGDGRDETETGYIASSRFYWRFNENVFLTNDTDVLESDEALRVNNDFGVNFRMTDAFSTRVSYLTDYNEARAIRTDNKLGVSLVYGF
ncbi:DUF481 domain-containing protein [Cereibacter azotoformans]|uniref:Putative salt-induced outer membrane protein n=1 Tax=Cereibacter azotoformans TaxID=43057 RepID=A0A2T5KF57_9RHOB|nr:DUF481 domain-containing protein [Cereibacter azotoformans]AXQ92682.1 DUF481 domain-containing protein [Cereibacter sphaeroides]MBO4169731.1 DUF481 domain-containing protein [Cereibacter azotoformans]PTR21007.1 putative salt-induced outer membrane protein [Cereibacter azotoformans]UIJ30963.1 DUF481 domain-containing protein [Cereibacter azotoformans]ULB08727.1 DUF481 domain-containing protein [Cereibacter azotoformans]